MSRFGVLAAICFAGCAAEPDTAPVDSCQSIYDQFQTLGSQLPRNCEADSDCVMVGGQVYGDYCGCTAALASFAVNAAAYENSEAHHLSTEFAGQCTGDPFAPSVCDRGPMDASCIDHICHAYGGDSCYVTDAAPAP